MPLFGGRQGRRTNHEKLWDYVHPAIKQFFTSALVSYEDTSGRQNYIGAEAAAYDKQMLPILEWKGPGEVVMKQLIQTAPQVFVTQSVVPTGIAGIQTGQMWNGGMADNPNAGDTLQAEVF
jgi:hypothetical protein